MSTHMSCQLCNNLPLIKPPRFKVPMYTASSLDGAVLYHSLGCTTSTGNIPSWKLHRQSHIMWNPASMEER